ncbi:MAG: acyl-CoA carboxylase subunit beta [Phycisphaerales bacterium JB037]
MPTTPSDLQRAAEDMIREETQIRYGGGEKAIERQHAKNRLTARERIHLLVDNPGDLEPDDDAHPFMELGLWYAWNMYREHGGAPAAGVVTGIGPVQGRPHMIIANDATVKAGAFFPMTCKKIIRAQTIAQMARLPLIYLVDSAGVFLPMQEDVFPDTDDFGRIFRNNAVISAQGIPQIAAIMGYCVAGGGYLPVLCDTLLMTEGSGLYLAGQALVKAAIGQEVSEEELGGAEMHAQVSGTIDFREPDDRACIRRIRDLVDKYGDMHPRFARPDFPGPARNPHEIYDIFTSKPGEQYDALQIIACIADGRTIPNDEGHETLVPDFDEYKPEYGTSLLCGYARLGGRPVGILANQGKLTTRVMPGGKAGPSKSVNMPRVIYDESADKAARFIMDCNQRRIPLVFLHDTTGFMVGRDSEQGGIIRAGAKMVNAMSNCIVPKIVVMMGSSYGAGNYAMCGRAFDQFLSFAWAGAKCAVMGAAQATGTLAMIEERSRQRKGEEIDPQTHEQILSAVRASYDQQQDIRYGAARGWVDRLIQPHETRKALIRALDASHAWNYAAEFRTGVLQT